MLYRKCCAAIAHSFSLSLAVVQKIMSGFGIRLKRNGPYFEWTLQENRIFTTLERIISVQRWVVYWTVILLRAEIDNSTRSNDL